MKYILSTGIPLLLSLLSPFQSSAQTALAAGDIAFIGYNLDGVDDYAFILLADVDASTVIHFTDCGWSDAGAGSFSCNTGESAQWTWTSGVALTCGTVVNITVNNPGFVATIGTMSGTSPVFSGLGDQILAFQGTTASPTFIAGIHSNEAATDANWNGNVTSNSTSALPDALTAGTDALRLHDSGTERDNWQYDCSTLTGTVAVVRAAINDVNNWNFNDVTPFTPANPACVFAITHAVAGPEIDIEGNFTSITNGDATPDAGDHTRFGLVAITGSSIVPFTIQNEGTADLTLSGGPTFVTLTGSALFTISAQPSSGTIAAAGSETFSVAFNAPCPNAAGTYTAIVSVSSDDADESPYTFTVQATINGTDTDSDGELDACDADDDNDGILDGADPDDTDFNICGDSDADGCDDCSITNDGFGALSDSDPLNDGTDSDCDGICDATDPTPNGENFRGRMLEFDGTADYVEIGDVAELNFGKASAFTAEAWINTNSASTAMQIISKYEGNLLTATGWGFQVSGSSLAFYMAGGSFLDLMVSVPTGTPNVKDGLWHHVAVVYDGSNDVTGCTFYIDGVPFAGIDGGGPVTTVAGTVTNTEVAAIGAYNGTTSGAAEFWDGDMEEVRIWNTIRTQTEIRENLHLSITGACIASNVGYWKFNEFAGPTAADVSGNGNDGTYNGPPVIRNSQAAVSEGVSTTHLMNANATTYSSPAVTAGFPMDLIYTTTNPNGEVVVTCLFGDPVGGFPGPVGSDGAFHYWIVNNYGPVNAGLDGTMTFNTIDGEVVSTTLTEYSLQRRGSRETGAWTENNAAAITADATPSNNLIEFDGITGFSQYYPVSKTASSSLPVELILFEAAPWQSTAALLTWVTASEINNKGFQVQRSADAATWETIGFINGSGTRTTATEYSYTDYEAKTGTNYYRLVQVDFNNTATNSMVRSVVLENELGAASVQPNPNNGTFTLTVVGADDTDQCTVEVLNPLGRIILKEQMIGQRKNFQLNKLSAGLYFVKVTRGTETQLLRMVVQ